MTKKIIYDLGVAFSVIFCMMIVSIGHAHASVWTYVNKFGASGSGNGQLSAATMIAVSTTTGNVYVSDGGNSRVDIFDASGNFIKTFGWGVSDGSSTFEICSAPAVCRAGVSGAGAGQFSNHGLRGIVLDASGNIYVTDYYSDRVDIFDASGNFIKTFGWGVSDGSSTFEICSAPAVCQTGIGGPGVGQFSGPYGIAISPITGNIYVSDGNNSRIEIFSPSGSYISVIGSAGTGNGQLSTPQGSVFFDSSGDMYVPEGARVDFFNPSGNFVKRFGWGVSDGSSTPEICSAPAVCQGGLVGSGPGIFNQLIGVLADPSGNIYMSDISSYSDVLIYNSSFAYVSPLGTGVSGTSTGQFKSPTGMAFNAAGNIYVVDAGNNRIQEFAILSLPVVTTSAASAVNATSLTLNASIVSTGGYNASQSGFVYGTTTDLSISIATSTLGIQLNGATSFSQTLTGLTPNTTYYYSAYIANSMGTSTGAIMSVTTPSAPVSAPVSQIVPISFSGGSVSAVTLASLLAPSASTTAYLKSIGYVPAVSSIFHAPSSSVATSVQTLPSVFSNNLVMGSVGSEVKALQIYLNTHGYVIASSGPGSPGNETTLFGVLTRAAITRLQAAVGIMPVSGVFGPKTRAYVNGRG